MATSKETVAFLLEQLAPLDVRARAMFGGYGLYCDDKIVGLICDELLFVKPSPGDGQFGPHTVPAPPYPGAKDYWLVSGDQVNNDAWLKAFIQSTADALPSPAPKTAKQS